MHQELPAAREAFSLPLLLQSVVLLGSLRVSETGELSFVAPTLLSLVLAVMVAGLLIRSGILVPDALLSPARSALANLNGLSVLLSLLFASAQVFTMLTPEGGLLGVLFNAFFVGMLWTTGAARPDAPRLMRSLMVLFGWSLVIRFVILNGLVAPDASLARRLFAVALEGVTLGALGLRYQTPATGYIAFAMLALFFVSLLMMAASSWSRSLIADDRPLVPSRQHRASTPQLPTGHPEP